MLITRFLLSVLNNGLVFRPCLFLFYSFISEVLVMYRSMSLREERSWYSGLLSTSVFLAVTPYTGRAQPPLVIFLEAAS